MAPTTNWQGITLYKTEAVATFGTDAERVNVWIDDEDMTNYYVERGDGFVAIDNDNEYLFDIEDNKHYMFVVDIAGNVEHIDLDYASGGYATCGNVYKHLSEAISAARKEFNDWYAVDSLDAATGRVHRLYVGDGKTACKMAGEYASGANLVSPDGSEPAEPGEYGPARFYRATLIDAKAAHDYFMGGRIGGGELVTVAQAAKELGITRQSAYGLVERGVLPSEECMGLRVGMYSVALRLAAKA